jgi:hypothetical protein
MVSVKFVRNCTTGRLVLSSRGVPFSARGLPAYAFAIAPA